MPPTTRSKFRFIKSSLLGGVGAAAMLISPITQSAHANAVIFNNADPALRTLALGVNDAGHLNIFDSSFSTTKEPLGNEPRKRSLSRNLC